MFSFSCTAFHYCTSFPASQNLISDISVMAQNAKAFNQKERPEYVAADELECKLEMIKSKLLDQI